MSQNSLNSAAQQQLKFLQHVTRPVVRCQPHLEAGRRVSGSPNQVIDLSPGRFPVRLERGSGIMAALLAPDWMAADSFPLLVLLVQWLILWHNGYRYCFKTERLWVQFHRYSWVHVTVRNCTTLLFWTRHFEHTISSDHSIKATEKQILADKVLVAWIWILHFVQKVS